MGSVQRYLRRWFLSFVVLSSISVYAQYSSNVQGVVSDPAGAAINGASIQLRNVENGVTTVVKTTDSGNYRFSSLEPGNYVLTVEANGFRKTESNFTLETSETKGINLTLPVASSQQTITVEVHPPAVDTDDSRLQATLSSDTVRDLPSANRNLWDILAVTPGVVGVGTRLNGEAPGGLPDNFGTQTPQISANGRSYTGNIVMVDGLNVTSPVQNGNVILAPIPDAVQEASLQANSFGAENNLGSSIVIQVTTKSGTNQFHGTGSLFFANQDLQARPDFVTGPTEPYARKDLVGALGGPIRKGKTFFFADFEKLWSTVPGATGQQFFEDPQFVQWAQTNYPNTVGTQMLTGWPASALPSGVCGTSGAPPCNLPMIDGGSFNAAEYYNALQYNFRVDQYFTDRDRLYLSYYNDSFDQQQKSPRPRLGALDIMRNRYAQIDFTHTFNSNLLWESSFAFASVGGANGQDANLAVPNVTVLGNVTGWPVGGGWGPGEYRGPMYNWRSVLNWVHGKHTLKFGYDGARGIEHGDFTPVNVRPGFTFNNLLDLVQDNVFQESVGAYNPLTGLAGTVQFGGQENPFGFFAQDDWKVKSNLSLTLSMRYDDFTNHTPWGNSGFQFSALNLASAGNFQDQVKYASVGQVPAVFAHSMADIFSPRIGFAWDPSKTGRWAVRGGVGVYHDWIAMGQTIDQTRNNPPGVLSETFTSVAPNGQPLGNYFSIASSETYPWGFVLPSIPAGSLNAQGGITGIPTNVDSLDRNMKAPMAVNYVIGVEHQLPGNLVAGASYSGSRSFNGLTGADVNRVPGDISFAGCVAGANYPSCQGVVETFTRPNASFGQIIYVNNANQATYNAMILSLRGRAGRRANFQASYTLSHAKDYPEANTRFDQDGQTGSPTASNIPDPSAYFNYYGDANYDVRHRFSFSGLYTIPGLKTGIGRVLTDGWEVSAIVAVQTGTPFWVIDNRNADVMCAPPAGSGGAPTGCSGAPAGYSAITPNVIAPDSGDYNLDGVSYDIPLAATQNFTGSHSRSAYLKGIFPTPPSTAFGPPAQGSQGTEPRNIYRNPGMFQADASLFKNNHLPWLGEQGNLQFRFDFLNLFNHGNLGNVDPDMGDGNFGKVTSTLNPFDARKIELGVRISF